MSPSRVVHLELHTDDLGAAGAFYYELPPWRAEQIDSPWGSYHALLLGDGLGIAACGTRRAGRQPAFGASEGQVGPIAKPGHPAPQKSCERTTRGRLSLRRGSRPKATSHPTACRDGPKGVLAKVAD
jgi:hypothetical protein